VENGQFGKGFSAALHRTSILGLNASQRGIRNVHA